MPNLKRLYLGMLSPIPTEQVERFKELAYACTTFIIEGKGEVAAQVHKVCGTHGARPFFVDIV